jgi:hypothetical protein
MARSNTVVIGTTSYRQAFDRIRAEYQEMPGMRLTLQQVERLSAVEASICRRVLEDLVRAKFLRADSDGAYRRATADVVGDGNSRWGAAGAQVRAGSRSSQRAG